MIRVELEKWGQSAEDLRCLSIEAEHRRTRERFMTLYIMVSQSICATKAARETGRSDETVLQWVRNYNEQGPEALTYRHNGGRRPFSNRRPRNKSSTPSTRRRRRTTTFPVMGGH